MADLAKTSVTINAEYKGQYNNRRVVIREVTVVLATMGSATNKVLASALGFTKVLSTTPFVKDDDTLVIPGGPSTDGSMILLKAAGTAAPADISGTFKATVQGTTN